ncbi:MAG: phasin family protein [Acidobacteriota bacterium]
MTTTNETPEAITQKAAETVSSRLAELRQSIPTERLERLGGDLSSLGRKVWLAGLGAVAEAEEQGRGAFERLVDRGETFRAERKQSLQETLSSTRENSRKVREWATGTVEQGVKSATQATNETLQRFGVPTYDDIQTLNERIEQLNRKVDALGSSSAS